MDIELRNALEQMLSDNGYFYNRKLTDSELVDEFEEMLDDLDMLEKTKGMSTQDAINYIVSL